MKTLADLKRDAKSGRLFGEMVLRCGETEIPEKLQGKRQIVDSNSVGITFLNNNGKRSELRIEAASLVDYDGINLTVYRPGKRPLNEQEQAIMNKWQAIADTDSYKNQSRIDALSDGSQTYYQKKHFFTDCGYEYLLGFDWKAGKKYEFSTGLIIDNKIKGDPEMVYKISFS